jgi:plasmid stabilization system protein ParE
MPTGRRIRKRRVGLKLVWTERAMRDLEKIDDYIAEDSPAAAARWLAKLIATAATIPSAPLIRSYGTGARSCRHSRGAAATLSNCLPHPRDANRHSHGF